MIKFPIRMMPDGCLLIIETRRKHVPEVRRYEPGKGGREVLQGNQGNGGMARYGTRDI